MKEVVSDEIIFKKALKRDRFRCSSCNLTPADTVLDVVWTIDNIQQKDRILKNSITLCPECRVAPLRYRRAPSISAYRPTIEQISAQRHQHEQFKKLEKRAASDARKAAVSSLESLGPGNKWKDNDIISMQKFIDKLGVESVQTAVGITVSRAGHEVPEERFRYFCGICWNWIKGT